MMMILRQHDCDRSSSDNPHSVDDPERTAAEQGLIVISPIDPADWENFRRIPLAASRRESRGFFERPGLSLAGVRLRVTRPHRMSF